jgi:hypothetical protein
MSLTDCAINPLFEKPEPKFKGGEPMNKQPYIIVSGIIFALISAAHIVRIVLTLPAQFAGHQIPLWPSWAGAAGTGIMAIWAFRVLEKKSPLD